MVDLVCVCVAWRPDAEKGRKDSRVKAERRQTRGKGAEEEWKRWRRPRRLARGWQAKGPAPAEKSPYWLLLMGNREKTLERKGVWPAGSNSEQTRLLCAEACWR